MKKNNFFASILSLVFQRVSSIFSYTSYSKYNKKFSVYQENTFLNIPFYCFFGVFFGFGWFSVQFNEHYGAVKTAKD